MPDETIAWPDWPDIAGNGAELRELAASWYESAMRAHSRNTVEYFMGKLDGLKSVMERGGAPAAADEVVWLSNRIQARIMTMPGGSMPDRAWPDLAATGKHVRQLAETWHSMGMKTPCRQTADIFHAKLCALLSLAGSHGSDNPPFPVARRLALEFRAMIPDAVNAHQNKMKSANDGPE